MSVSFKSFFILACFTAFTCLGVFANSLLAPPTQIQVEGAEVIQPSSTIAIPESNVFPGTNIRYSQVIGVRTAGQDFPELGWFRSEWNGTMAEAISRHPTAFAGHARAVLGKSIRWRDCLVDSNRFMTVAEMADPSHSNYVWNQPDRDGLTEALSDPLVRDGIVKIALVVADSHSGARRAVPLFLMDMQLGFEGHLDERNHVLRLDKAAARDYSVAFFTALLSRWGNDPGLHSVNISEYFAGDAASHPEDFSLAEHVRGRATMWQRIIDAAPLDSNGNRVAIVQTSPLLQSGVTAEDLASIRMGISQPDPDVFQHQCGAELPESTLCDLGSVSRGLQDLYSVVPSFVTQDDRYARLERRSGGWPSSNLLPNPFGIAAGDSEVASIEHVMWYRCNVVPADSTMFHISTANTAQGIWDEDSFFRALGRFGSGGSESCGSGAFPPLLN